MYTCANIGFVLIQKTCRHSRGLNSWLIENMGVHSTSISFGEMALTKFPNCN
jgi:hypothetical protein